LAILLTGLEHIHTERQTRILIILLRIILNHLGTVDKAWTSKII